MKRKVMAILILFSSACLAQVKMNEEWKDIFRVDERAQKMDEDMRAEFGDTNQLLFNEFKQQGFRKLEKEVSTNNVGKTNLKFGFEILRVNEKNQKIILRKYDYPLPDIKDELVQSNLITNANINMYSGLFAIPILTLDLKKDLLLSSKNNQTASSVLFGIIIVPLKKERDTYTLKMSLAVFVKLLGEIALPYFRSLDIRMQVGEKIKILIDPTKLNQTIPRENITGMKLTPSKEKSEGFIPMGSHVMSISSDPSGNWTVFPTINGQVVKFSSHDDFFKGIKDYLILSFESDK